MRHEVRSGVESDEFFLNLKVLPGFQVAVKRGRGGDSVSLLGKLNLWLYLESRRTTPTAQSPEA